MPNPFDDIDNIMSDFMSWSEGRPRPRPRVPAATGAPVMPIMPPQSARQQLLAQQRAGEETPQAAAPPIDVLGTVANPLRTGMPQTSQSLARPAPITPPASPTTPFGVNVYNGDEQSRTMYTPLGPGPAAADGTPGQQQYSGVSNSPATPMSSPSGADRNAFMNAEMIRAGAMNGAGGLSLGVDRSEMARNAGAAWDAQQRESGLNTRGAADRAANLEGERIRANREMGPVQTAEMLNRLSERYDVAFPTSPGPEHRAAWMAARQREAVPGAAPIPPPASPQSAMDTAAGITRRDDRTHSAATASIHNFMRDLVNNSGSNPPSADAVEAYIREHFPRADSSTWTPARIREAYGQYQNRGSAGWNPFSSSNRQDPGSPTMWRSPNEWGWGQ